MFHRETRSDVLMPCEALGGMGKMSGGGGMCLAISVVSFNCGDSIIDMGTCLYLTYSSQAVRACMAQFQKFNSKGPKGKGI